MRNLGAACLRYSAQTYAYALLVTSRYPYGAPILHERRDAGGRGARAGSDACGRRRFLKLVLAALVVAALAVGAFLLYPTAVPDDLRLAPSTSNEVFGAHFVDAGEALRPVLLPSTGCSRRSRFSRRCGSTPAAAPRFVRESSAGPIGTGMLLGMLGLGIAWLVHLPFAVAAHWWQRRWGQSELSYLDWIFQDWATLAAEFLSICIALLIVMGLARRLGERWWLPGAAVFVAIASIFTFVAPYLDFTTKPLRDEALLEAARAVRGGARRRTHSSPGRGGEPGHRPGERLRLRARAFAARRLLGHDAPPAVHGGRAEGRPRARARAPLAASTCRRASAWFALFALPGAWILMRATRRRGGMGDARGRSARAARRRGLPARDAAARQPPSRAAWRPRPTGRHSR